MLSFSEMAAVVDRATSGGITSIVKIRDELTHNWALDDMQIQRVIFDMRDVGLIA